MNARGETLTHTFSCYKSWKIWGAPLWGNEERQGHSELCGLSPVVCDKCLQGPQVYILHGSCWGWTWKIDSEGLPAAVAQWRGPRFILSLNPPSRQQLSFAGLWTSLCGPHTMDLTPWTSHRGPHTVDLTPWTSHRGPHHGPHTVDLTPWTSHRGPHSVDLTPWTAHRGPHSVDLTPWTAHRGPHHGPHTVDLTPWTSHCGPHWLSSATSGPCPVLLSCQITDDWIKMQITKGSEEGKKEILRKMGSKDVERNLCFTR